MTFALEIEGLSIQFGDAPVVSNFNLNAHEGEHVTFLGPSGCGKTSTLRAIAGLERPSQGTIKLFGETVYSEPGRINVPPEKRDVSMVFQSYAIWPHLTVFENVAYGLRVRKTPRDELEERVTKALDTVGLRDFARRGATELSGGQQQRVALARSFVFNPRILLFDEPLSNLDAQLRAKMRRDLKQLQRDLGITSVYVTHDQEEALSMSDRILVMNAGRVDQMGDPLEVYMTPQSRFVAEFVGSSNILRVKITAGDPATLVLENGHELVWPGLTLTGVQEVAIKYGHVTLAPRAGASDPATNEETELVGRIQERTFVGDVVDYTVDCDGLLIRARTMPHGLLDPGQEVVVRIRPEHIAPLTK